MARKLFLTLLLFLPFLIVHATAFSPHVASAAPVGCLPPPSGLAGWWSGDHHAYDLSSNANDGTWQGGAPAYAPGKSHYAFNFNGEKVAIPNSASLNPAAISIDVWVYPTSNAVTQHIVSKGDTTGPYSLELINLFPYFKFVPTGPGHPGTLSEPLSNDPLPLNAWSHIAVTYDGDTTAAQLNGYVNGVLTEATLEPTARSGFVTTDTAGVFIGGDSTTTERFIGLVDEPHIFNRALTGIEVKSIYDAGVFGFCREMVVNTSASGTGSLEQAIENVNAHADLVRRVLAFEIPGSGIQTIAPTGLTTVGVPVVLTGYSQPGSSPATPTDAPAIKVQLDFSGDTGGLSFVSSKNIVEGFSIVGSPGVGLLFNVSGTNTIRGNYIGLLADGTTVKANNSGVYLQGAHNVFGSVQPSDRNVVSGNTTIGIRVNSIDNQILGNYIGTDAAGSAAKGNGSHGIYFDPTSAGASQGIVGGTITGMANVIAFNGGDGVRVDGTNPNSQTLTTHFDNIQGNSIFSNTGLGIALVNGGNDNLAAPVITSVNATEAKGTSCSGCIVGLFQDSGSQGRVYLQTRTAVGTAWTIPLFGSASPTLNFTATATDTNGNTSQFSLPVPYDSTPPTVTIDSILPNPTNAGTTVTWHADENGTFSVRVGGTDCSTGTQVTAGSGSYSGQPTTTTTAIQAGELAEGSNTVRVCVKDAANNTGTTTGSVTKDTTAPVVSVSASPNPTNGGTTVTWSATESGNAIVSVGGSSNCTGGTTIVASTAYTAPTPVNTPLTALQIPSPSNTVYVCVTDATGNVGFNNVVVTVDKTVPTVTFVSVSPNPTTTTDPTVTWSAGEKGTFSIRVGGTSCSTGVEAASGPYTTSPSNTTTVVPLLKLSVGKNDLRVCVTDAARNTGSATGSVTVVPSQCAGMTFDQTVVMTSSLYTSFSTNKFLIFAPQTGNASVTLSGGGDSCIVAGNGTLSANVTRGNNVLVGGPARDVLTGGSGSDKLYGGGAPAGLKDTLVGNGGTDTCVGEPAQTTKTLCEN